MQRILALLALSLALTACNDTTEEQVLSNEPIGTDDAAVMKQEGQAQLNTVDGMYEQGSLNAYEKQQMDESIGSGQ